MARPLTIIASWSKRKKKLEAAEPPKWVDPLLLDTHEYHAAEYGMPDPAVEAAHREASAYGRMNG